jgi:hypothetical protein
MSLGTKSKGRLMFGWFRQTCPCDPAAKHWVENRLQWLSRQFGLHLLLERPIILPTPEFFPDAWDGSPKAVRHMFRRVCRYMEVDPDTVEIKLFTDKTPGTAAALGTTGGFAAGTWQGGEGPWQKGIIRIERSVLDRPSDLVGTMAHELAHQRLLSERRADRDAYDNELLTDLTAVYHGFGVFLANNPRKSTGELGYWPGTKLRKPEYLSEPMLGYALAHVGWFRDEDRPAWTKHLRWVPRAVFKQGLRYLQQTADSAFKPVRLRASRGEDA